VDFVYFCGFWLLGFCAFWLLGFLGFCGFLAMCCNCCANQRRQHIQECKKTISNMRQQNQEQEFSPNGCKYQYIFQHQSATHTIHTRNVTLNTLHALCKQTSRKTLYERTINVMIIKNSNNNNRNKNNINSNMIRKTKQRKCQKRQTATSATNKQGESNANRTHDLVV
jgi:esterase/lipase